jgi:hypothetical protein
MQTYVPPIVFAEYEPNYCDIFWQFTGSLADESQDKLIGHIAIGTDKRFHVFGSGSDFALFDNLPGIAEGYESLEEAELIIKTMRSHWGVWHSMEKPLPGVIDTPNFLFEDSMYSDQIIDLQYIDFLEGENLPFVIDGMSIDLEYDKLSDKDLETIESYEPYESGTMLVGNWYFDLESKTWEVLPEVLRAAGSLPYSAIVYADGNSHIVHSDWIDRSAYCSPCYPGSADLNTEGDQLVYALPAEYTDSEDWQEQPPYPDRLVFQNSVYNPLCPSAIVSRGDYIDRKAGVVCRFGSWRGTPDENQPLEDFLKMIGDLWIMEGSADIAQLLTLVGVFILGSGSADSDNPGFREAFKAYTGSEYRFPM